MKSWRSSFWRFVNSNLGIWFLSTVVVGGASIGITWWTSQLAAERSQSQQMEQIETEVMMRFFQPVKILSAYWQAGRTAELVHWERHSNVYYDQIHADSLLKEHGANGFSAEFRDCPTVALFSRYRALTRDGRERQNLDIAFACIKAATIQNDAILAHPNADNGGRLNTLSVLVERAFYCWAFRKKDLTPADLEPAPGQSAAPVMDRMYLDLLKEAGSWPFPIVLEPREKKGE